MKTTREREYQTENNSVAISGVIASPPEYNHEQFGEKFYQVMLRCQRQSEFMDTLPIVVSERLVNIEDLTVDTYIELYGQVRTHNQHSNEGKKAKLVMYIFVQEMTLMEEPHEDENNVHVVGYICKPPIYRKTPLGREICDLLVAVNRPYGKSDYIPTIAWGRNAKFAGGLNVGANINIYGRLQSREYNKKLNEDGSKTEKRVAYELSVGKLTVVDE